MIPAVKIFLIFFLYNWALLGSCMGTESQGHPIQNSDISNKDFYVDFPSDAKISFNSQWGTVRFLKSSNLTQDLEQQDAFRNLQAANQFNDIVLKFVDAYRVLFKLTNPSVELVVHSVQTDDLGFTQVRLKQMVRGIPVWGAEIMVQLDRDNHVNLVQGHYYPTPVGVDPHPKLTTEVVRENVASHLGLPDSSCSACTTSLVIFFKTEGPSPRLAYSVHTPVSLIEGWNLIVDAETGRILQKLPTVFSQ